MNKEFISDKQGISSISLFILGTSVLYLNGLDAEKDFWISTILSILLILPIVLIYCRLRSIFPNKDLYEIIEFCFGKFIGKLVIIFYVWYFFEDYAEMTLNFSYFATTTTLNKTPLIILIVSVNILTIWTVKKGIEVLSRLSVIFLIILLIFLFFLILLSIPNMDINNIRPVLYKGITPVIKASLIEMAFPFGQFITLMAVFSNLNKKSYYKVYTIGYLIGSIVLFIISSIGIIVLGVSEASSVLYPTYTVARRVSIGYDFLNTEIIISSLFTLGAIFKASITLLATCKGVAKVFNKINYRFIIIPIALLNIILSIILFDGPIEFFDFTEVWAYYAIPFQVILPIILYIVAEIKKKITS